jgi:hypothetical protein
LAVLFLSALLATVLPGTIEASDQGSRNAKPYALIFGSVFDPEGHTLYGVKVKIRRADEKKARWELFSNHTGEFAQRVPPGPADYVVWADVKGYKLADGRRVQPGPDVKVHIEADERSDIGVHLSW